MTGEEKQTMRDEARELYLRNGGRDHRLIEAEMRSRGWKFNRKYFYAGKNGSPGWPEQFGWVEMLKKEEREWLSRIKKNRSKNFPGWLRAEFPEWKWGWRFQRHIYKRLASVTTGETKRLMIFMPPRHGKSEMVTIRYTAWRLLRDLRLNVILGSYNQRLADKFSRKIKRIVTSGKGRVTRAEAGISALVPGPSSLAAKPLNSAAEWETAGGGVVRSVGVGGGIAGFGAGLVVIDDPVRNRADAESEVFRSRVWEWFNDDIYTRLEPDAAIILIQTRWHEDDLAGRLLKEMEDGGEEWEVVCLPALSEPPALAGGVEVGGDEAENHPVSPKRLSPLLGKEGSVADDEAPGPPAYAGGSDPLGRKPGQALCPERYDVKALARIKRKLGSYSFSALYQQSPAPAEGGMFKREWFTKIMDEAPPDLRWKRGYDLAVSTRTSADYTASFRCAKDKMGNLYIADGMRARIEYPEQRRYAIERMQAEKNTEHGIESALHGAAFVQDIRRDMRFGHVALRKVKVDADKLTRALAWLNLAEEGKVFLVRGPWIDEFVDEVARFPAGRHDDQVDAVSVAVKMLAHPGGTTHGF